MSRRILVSVDLATLTAALEAGVRDALPEPLQHLTDRLAVATRDVVLGFATGDCPARPGAGEAAELDMLNAEIERLQRANGRLQQRVDDLEREQRRALRSLRDGPSFFDGARDGSHFEEG